MLGPSHQVSRSNTFKTINHKHNMMTNRKETQEMVEQAIVWLVSASIVQPYSLVYFLRYIQNPRVNLASIILQSIRFMVDTILNHPWPLRSSARNWPSDGRSRVHTCDTWTLSLAFQSRCRGVVLVWDKLLERKGNLGLRSQQLLLAGSRAPAEDGGKYICMPEPLKQTSQSFPL